MFSFIHKFSGQDIKLLLVSSSGVAAVNVPSLIIDYTNALEVVLRLGFTVAVGALTLLHTWRKLKKNE